MKKQRILSLLLSLAMVFSMLSVSTAAVDVKTFEDVSKDDWFYKYVDFVADEEYFVGTSKTTFSPEMAMTRAMFVVVLAALENVKVDNNVAPFADVPANTWYSGAVAWAAEKGVVAGVGDNKFAPNTAISREQMAVMMNAYINWHSAQTGKAHGEESKVDSFKDADKISSWAVKAVENCRNWGLIAGMPDGNFWPANTASRAEVATVIYNLAWMVRGGGGGGGGSSTDYILDSVTKAVKLFNDKMPNYADAYGSSVALSDLTLDTTNGARNLAITGTVTANAETIQSLANFAVNKAAEIVGALAAGDEADAIINANKGEIVDKAEDIANTIINKLNGFFGTSLNLDELDKDSIKENIKVAYENGVKFGKDAWKCFVPFEGMAVTDDITISVNGTEVAVVEVSDDANLSVEGKAVDAVKNLAVAIAKDLYSDLTKETVKKAVTAIDPSVDVVITFSKGDYSDTEDYPYVYTLTMTADLEGTAADNIEYWFEGGEHNVNLVVGSMGEMYDTYAQQILAEISKMAVDQMAPSMIDKVDDLLQQGEAGYGYDLIIDFLANDADDIHYNAATMRAIDKVISDSEYGELIDELDDALVNYAKAMAFDAILVQAGVLKEGESKFVTEEVINALDDVEITVDQMQDLADKAGVDASKYDKYIEKLEVLLEKPETISLGDLAKAIELADEKGLVPEVVNKFAAAVELLPEDASVTVDSRLVINKAELAGDDVVDTVVTMLKKVGDLTLESFKDGVQVKAVYGERDAVVNFYIGK